MAVGPSQTTALVLLLGGAFVQQGLQSFWSQITSLVTPSVPASSSEAPTAIAEAVGWSVSVSTALQGCFIAFLLGIGFTLYVCYKFGAGLGQSPPLQLAIANRSDVVFQEVNTKSHEGRVHPRRGKSGILERRQAGPADPGLV